MAGSKEIRSKIGSVKNTQKITRAMELVAASKMRKAQDRMKQSKPYAQKIRQMVSHIAKAHSEYQHPFLMQKTELDIKKVGLIVVATDRGLCGGLNVNLFKKTIQKMQLWQESDVEIETCLIGRKAMALFSRLQAKVLAQADHLGDAPLLNDMIGVIKTMLDRFESGELDALYIASNEFVNTMSQQPQLQQLLPVVPDEKETQAGYWDYLYEPDAKHLLDVVLKRYVESQVYQSVVENVACEQAARMVAMKSATDNAGEVIKNLQLVYNKARQAAITQEISEIVSGANAVEA